MDIVLLPLLQGLKRKKKIILILEDLGKTAAIHFLSFSRHPFFYPGTFSPPGHGSPVSSCDLGRALWCKASSALWHTHVYVHTTLSYTEIPEVGDQGQCHLLVLLVFIEMKYT